MAVQAISGNVPETDNFFVACYFGISICRVKSEGSAWPVAIPSTMVLAGRIFATIAERPSADFARTLIFVEALSLCMGIFEIAATLSKLNYFW
jgi:hypothetical protein